MAELVNIAGDGLPLYIWATFAKAGQTAWDVGRQRAEQGAGGFAFDHTVVREVDGQVAACLISYPKDDSPNPPDHDAPAPLGSLIELGNRVTNTWYLNILATFPQYRGSGIGAELLRIADQRARAAGLSRISLTVSDANETARRLYERNGYVEFARAPIEESGWDHAGKNWILLVKNL